MMKKKALQTLQSGTKYGGIRRFYMSIPLESAHINHEVGVFSTMAPKLLKQEIKDKISDLVSKGKT